MLDFGGGAISGDGGLLLLGQLDRKLGLMKRAGKAIDGFETRQPGKIRHLASDMFRQRVLGLAAGHEDLNDQLELSKDPLLQSAVGRDGALAQPSTLCRFENRATRELNVALSKLMVEQFVESFAEPPDELVLDFDATDDPVHGMQEGRFFHGYYDSYCFLPLYVFCGDQLLVAYLRSSKIDGAKHAWAILKLLVTRFRRQWPGVRVVFRGDSGFCRNGMLRWCERNGVDYIVGIARNSRLEALGAKLREDAGTLFAGLKAKTKLFGEFRYRAGTWESDRLVIAKAEHNRLGPNYRCIVTSLPGDGRYLYEEVYCARGGMENRIKEQQLDLFAGRTSCHAFDANQFRLLLSGFAYILMERFRALLLKGTKFARATCGTIRLNFIRVGAVVRRNTRRLYCSLSSSCPVQGLFLAVARRILLLS